MTQPWARRTNGSIGLVLKCLPVLVLVIAGIVAHARMEVRVEANAQRISRVEGSLEDWLTRVEAKLDRVIEREFAR